MLGKILSTMLISVGTTALIFHTPLLSPVTGIKKGTPTSGALPLYM